MRKFLITLPPLCTSRIHFFFKNTPQNAIKTNGPEKLPKPPFPFEDLNPIPHSPSKRQLDRLTHFTQLRNKVPFDYKGHPNSPPMCPFSLGDHHRHLIHSSLVRLTHLPKRHPDPISRFSIINPPDKQAHTHRRMGLATSLFQYPLTLHCTITTQLKTTVIKQVNRG